MTNEILLCSTGNCIQCSVVEFLLWGQNIKNSIFMYMYKLFILLTPQTNTALEVNYTLMKK